MDYNGENSNDHSALKTKDGTLYFGGAHGFNYFDPNKINLQ